MLGRHVLLGWDAVESTIRQGTVVRPAEHDAVVMQSWGSILAALLISIISVIAQESARCA